MPSSEALLAAVNSRLAQLAQAPGLEAGIDVAMGVLELLGIPGRQSSAVVDESVISLPNSERQD